MAVEPFETAESLDFPTVTQLSIFIDDRVGQLLRMTKLFHGTEIRIWGLMVVNSSDCAIVRIIFDDPDSAGQMLADHRYTFKETDVLAVCLPHGNFALENLWTAVLSAEINVHYTYALMGLPHGRPTMAIFTENIQYTAEALSHKNWMLLDHADLRDERNR